MKAHVKFRNIFSAISYYNDDDDDDDDDDEKTAIIVIKLKAFTSSSFC